MAHAHAQDKPGILREWAPLTDLFSKLPTKTQTGIFSQEIKLTCVDFVPEFIALGTNAGIVYWYDRKKKDLQRLRCENSNVPITSVKVISTVDYMVACGNNLGNISIFQIPKSFPDSLPENLRPKNKQVERYTVTDLHKTPITALEWSKNGMKLFSGDKIGCVVLTEIDFYMHICQSLEILNESYEIVQLSYNQQKLLVSTTYRSIICQKQDKWKVCQVGKKDRKVLGNFGGVIYQNGYKLSDTHLYCTRPGLRIWIADIDGNVQKTLLFKDLLCKECPEVPIINPVSRNLQLLKPQKEPSFGILLPFNDRLLVTYNNDVVYILDPQEMIILFTISHLRSVLSVATHKDEIFILEEQRSLIRIAFKPESYQGANLQSPNSFLPLNSIKELTTKLQASTIISAIPPLLENAFNNDINIHTDDTLIMNAEEAKESPIRIRSIDPELQKKFDEIGKQEFEDKILFKKNKCRKKNSTMTNSTCSLSSNSSEEKDLSYTRPTLMNLSAVGVLPDLRSPESIKNDIEYKEKILADVLNLDKVKLMSHIDENKGSIKNEEKIDCDDKMIDEEPVIDIRKSESKRENGKISVSKIGENNLAEQTATNSKPSTSASVKFDINAKGTPVRNIPNYWKLSNIQLQGDNNSSDNSLSDWEIV